MLTTTVNLAANQEVKGQTFDLKNHVKAYNPADGAKVFDVHVGGGSLIESSDGGIDNFQIDGVSVDRMLDQYLIFMGGRSGIDKPNQNWLIKNLGRADKWLPPCPRQHQTRMNHFLNLRMQTAFIRQRMTNDEVATWVKRDKHPKNAAELSKFIKEWKRGVALGPKHGDGYLIEDWHVDGKASIGITFAADVGKLKSGTNEQRSEYQRLMAERCENGICRGLEWIGEFYIEAGIENLLIENSDFSKATIIVKPKVHDMPAPKGLVFKGGKPPKNKSDIHGMTFTS